MKYLLIKNIKRCWNSYQARHFNKLFVVNVSKVHLISKRRRERSVKTMGNIIHIWVEWEKRNITITVFGDTEIVVSLLKREKSSILKTFKNLNNLNTTLGSIRNNLSWELSTSDRVMVVKTWLPFRVRIKIKKNENFNRYLPKSSICSRVNG